LDKQIEAKIEIEGGDELHPFSSIRINQQIHQHLYFEITFPKEVLEAGSEPFSKKSQQLLGKSVKIIFRFAKEKAKRSIFQGVITEIGLAKNAAQGNEVALRGFSCSILLDGAENCRSFSDKSLQQIVETVLQPYPKNLLKTKVSPKSQDVLKYTVQYRENDFRFLSRLADRYGEWFFSDGEYLNFGELQSNAQTEPFLGRDLSRFELVQRIVHTKFRFKSYDYIKNEVYTTASADVPRGDLSPASDFAFQKADSLMSYAPLSSPSYKIDDENMLKALTGQVKAKLVNNLVTVNGVSEHHLMKVGEKIKLSGQKDQSGKGASESYGDYIVTSISHSIDATSNYQNYFEAAPAEAKSPMVNPAVTEPVGEMQLAVVKENNDRESLGRVRVNFSWQGSSELSPWLRVLTQHAGKDNGIYFIPEIDDEVLVGFEHNNPDKPFVLGSSFHGKIKPDKWHDPDNNIKVIKTKSGNIIYLNDEAGKEQIRIANEDDANQIILSLEGNGKITIQSKGDIEMSGKSIKLEAQELTIESVNTTMKSSGKCVIDGGSLTEVKAQLIKLN